MTAASDRIDQIVCVPDDVLFRELQVGVGQQGPNELLGYVEGQGTLGVSYL